MKRNIFIIAITLLSLSSYAQNFITNDFFGIEPVPANPALLTKALPVLNELNAGIIGINAFRWDHIQINETTYDWSIADSIMKMFHDNGFKLQINLICIADWAGMTQHEFPPDTAMFRTFIHDLIQRYNGDGINDAPGINSNVIQILNIGSEIDGQSGEIGHWHGTASEYAALQQILSEEVQAVEPSIIVARGASNFGEAGDDLPDYSTLEFRFNNLLPLATQSFIDTTAFQNESYYDLFGFHFNYYYSGIIPIVEFLRTKMQDSGFVKQFYSEDTRSALVNAYSNIPGFGLTYEFYDDVDNNNVPDIIDTLQNWPSSSNEYIAARERYYRDQAILLVKKLTVGLKAGLNPIIMSTFIDWPTYSMINWRHSGLIDAAEAGVDFSNINTTAAKKPAFFAYKHYINTIIGHERDVDRLNFGEHIWAFKFTKEYKNTYVIWYENIYNPDKSLDTVISLSNYIIADSVLVSETITAIGLALPNTYYTSKDSIRIGHIPIFISDSTQFTTVLSHDIEREKIHIYPNPSNGKFIIEIESEKDQMNDGIIIIYNALGEKVFKSDIKNLKSEIDLNLPGGTYIYRVTDNQGNINSGKIIIH